MDKVSMFFFFNFGSDWNEWLIWNGKDKERIRVLGSAIEETQEEKTKRESDESFRKRMAEKGFEIVECERDGNCLFHAIGHQIYGDANKHEEIRKECYEYMEKNKEFFAQYISDDFDTYIKKQKQDKQWGDHVEIVCLRELYNKEVQIYDQDSVRGPRPLGFKAGTSDDVIRTIRLSYHGANHYNSLVDPKEKPPLGDGKSSKINFREIRIDEEKKEAKLAAMRQSSQSQALRQLLSLSSGQRLIKKKNLLRDVDQNLKTTVTEEQFEELWLEIDNRKTGYIMGVSTEAFVGNLLKVLLKQRTKEKSTVEQAREQKIFNEMKYQVKELSETSLKEVRYLGLHKRISHDDWKVYFYTKLLANLLWRLSNS